MMFFVTKKEYNEVCRTVRTLSVVLDKVSLDLVRERKRRAEQEDLSRKLTEEGKKALEEIRIERRRADQFQLRCEAYEDAAKAAELEFVWTEDICIMQRREDHSFPCANENGAETSGGKSLWERLKAWPNG